MKDVNYPLQKAYLTALSGITYNGVAVPVYYQSLPDDVQPDNYIIFGPVSNNDTSTKTTADTDSSMRVTIHSFQFKYNTGEAINNIAGQVFAAIYPYPNYNIDLSMYGFQVVRTEMISDNTLDYNLINTRAYIDRIIIFRHDVYHI